MSGHHRYPCSIVLIAALAGCGHARPVLPKPSEPFTTTPDAPFRSSAPPPLSSETTQPRAVQVERMQLANGMRVYVLPRPDAKFVTVSYGNGAAILYEAGVPHGLSVLVGDALLYGGTRLEEHGEVMTRLQVGGMTPFVGTNGYGTTVELRVLSSGWDQALFVIARIVRGPAFTAGGIESARRDQMEWLIGAGDDLDNLAIPLTVKAAFGNSKPMPESPRERAAELLKLSVEDVRRYHARVYTPSNSVLVIAGPVTLSQVAVAIEKQFGDWSVAGGAASIPRRRTAQPTRQRAVHALYNGGDEATLYVIQPGVDFDTPDRIAWELLMEVVSGAANSRLPHVLRHENALVYSVASSTVRVAGGNVVGLITTRVKSRMLRRTLSMIREQLARLAETGVNERELAAAKSALRASKALDTTDWIASAVLDHAMIGSPGDWHATALRAIDAASLDDLKRTARHYLRSDNFPIVVIGGFAETSRQLRFWGPIEYLTWN